MTPYPFISQNNLSFEFSTTLGIRYKAYFVSANALFPEYPEFSNNIYSFNLDVVAGDVSMHPFDERIADTVISILNAFFIIQQNVIIYICDTTDGRAFVRNRKFDLWFWKYSDGNIIKEDCIAMIADNPVYSSLLVHKQNIYLGTIIKAFHALNERLNDEDFELFKDTE